MDTTWLAILVFLAALLYSSVGHAGASGYLAAMAIMNVPQVQMKPTALVLNILVATIGSIQFIRKGAFDLKTFLPFALVSVPAAFVGGMIHLPGNIYKYIIGATLLVASLRMVFDLKERENRPIPLWAPIVIGLAIGLISGMVGVGGGIFLSPLLILAGWATPRVTAGISALFILVNSLSGLAGQITSLQRLPDAIWVLIPAALAGGILGSWYGSNRAGSRTFKVLLAGVLLIAGIKMYL